MNRHDAETCKLFARLKNQFQEIGLEFDFKDEREFAAKKDGKEIFCCAHLSTAGGFYRCVKEIQLGNLVIDKRGVNIVRKPSPTFI